MQTPEQSAQQYQAQLQIKLGCIIQKLEKEADDRVSKRNLVEKRWLEDLQQYHGKYSDDFKRELELAKKSWLFINQTRPKTDSCEARLSDMLFPTDDRNFGVLPTPVPELTAEAEEAAQQAAKLAQQAEQNPEDPAAQQASAMAQENLAIIEARKEQARKRSKAMEEEIADHLKECRYSIQARDVIGDACKLGTGVMKGPVIGGRNRKHWKQTESGYQMIEAEDTKAAYWRVDPWEFFPDMDARTIDECEGIFERHRMNATELRRLSRQPGFDGAADSFRELLKDKPRDSTPMYIADIRSITGAYHDTELDRYHVWEYHGAMSCDDLRTIAEALGLDEVLQDAGVDGDIDPLIEIPVVIWFCQGKILKFGLHYLDSGEPIYSVFNLAKDEASIFGFGIPYMMRDSQTALNAGWRTMLDNAGLSSGPQIVVNQDVIEPANDSWALEPRKLWLRKPGANPQAPGFEQFNIASNQGELANIITMAKQTIDDETNIPVIAQGEQGAHVTQTAHGMSLLMNSVNVVFRRIVKNFDDDMTTPNIRRMYDFLMQFSPKEYIKGDYDVDARGSSVLLVREMQSANLMSFIQAFAGHPVLGAYLRDDGLPALRRLVQTMMLPSDELIKSDEDIQQEAAQAAQQPPQPDPEIMKLEAQMNLAQMELEGKMQLAEFQRETEMMRLAAQMNMKLEELEARLEEGRQLTASRERIFAGEAAMTARNGASGGGYM
jgi:hypothetical protein